MQRMRMKTLVTSIRVDARSVEELRRYWDGKGKHPDSLGSLLRMSLEALADLVVERFPGLAVATHREAVMALRRAGLVDLMDGSKRNYATLLSELGKENQELDHAVTPKLTEHLRKIMEAKEPEEDTVSIADLSFRPELVTESDGEESES